LLVHINGMTITANVTSTLFAGASFNAFGVGIPASVAGGDSTSATATKYMDDVDYTGRVGGGGGGLPTVRISATDNDAAEPALIAPAALPAEGTATFFTPSSLATVIAAVIPLALKLCVGFWPSSFIKS
jgi:hypothetical protein